MRRHFVLSAVLVVLSSTFVAAQTPTAPVVEAKTPSECTKTLNDWRNGVLAPAMTAMRNATTPETRADASKSYTTLFSAATAEAGRAAKVCAARFDVEKIASAQLQDLASLYAFAGDTAGRRRATARLLTATDLSLRQQAQALVAGMSEEIARSGSYFGIIDGAERMVARIDALPDSLSDIKLGAHQTMLGRYEYLDVNDGLRNHASALIALGRRLGNQSAMVNGFGSLARSAADRLQPDSALVILAEAEKELGTEQTKMRFFDFRHRYAMIGTKAAPIDATWWLNVKGTPAPVQPSDGKVRLVEFTATWCMPCKNSYPGLREIAARFRGKEFEGVLVTSLYGYLGAQRDLTPEKEVELDRVYYTQEHGLPFKVAIVAPVKGAQPKVDLDYRVGGIPQIVIIDKRGVVRQIVIGWDHGNTKRIGDLIDQLLREPSA